MNTTGRPTRAVSNNAAAAELSTVTPCRKINRFNKFTMVMATHDDWQSGRTLAQSTSFMFDQEIATDVTFKFLHCCETIKAHRFMLMARSHVFFTMFHSGLDKPGEAIEIPDIEPAIFKQFLRSLYIDDTKLTTTTALQLTYCAEKYQVKALKAQCMGFLRQQVNETTCAEILDHAVFYNDEPLTQACLHFLTSCKSLEIQGLQEYHISRETLEVIMDYEELTVSEVDIFKFCQTWAEQECKKKEVPVNMTNKRKMLGRLVKNIPFCSMKPEEFVAEVSGRHFLNGQEELQIFRYLGAADNTNQHQPTPTNTNPPFPCMKPRQAEGGEVSVKLPCIMWKEAEDEPVNFPYSWDSGNTDNQIFSIRCSQTFTLIGLTFGHPGTYKISFASISNIEMKVEPGCLNVNLEYPQHCEAGTRLKFRITSWFPKPLYVGFPFYSEVEAHPSGLNKKVDFVITRHNNHNYKPVFKALIVRH